LRHGLIYGGKTRWTQTHGRWLATVKLAHPAQQFVFTESWQAVQEAEARVERLTGALREALPGWRWGAVVTALMTLRGLDLVAPARWWRSWAICGALSIRAN